jgi:pimeloyl-ACP methyl ester carboxylesterase
MTWKTRHVTQVGELRIGWLEAGPAGGVASSARPVVLVHGLGTGDLWWTPTISVLAEDYRVLAVDLAGFGRTAGQPVRLDVAADQLAALAAAIGLERATFVGHSMGGLVTADLAARYPDVVERLVLVDAAGLPISQRVTRHLMNVVRASPFMPAAAYPIAVECVLRCGPLAIMRASHQLLTMDLTKRYAWVRAPTRILWGSRDHLLPPSFGHRLAEAIPGATMVEIPDAGHSPMWENPDEFHRQLVAFLEEPVRAPARHATATPMDTTSGLTAGLAPGLTAGVPLTAPTGGRVVSRYVPIGGASVHVRVGRPDDRAAPLETPPIVFVHGYVFASRTWQPTLERLASGHLVLAPDLTGFGWTSTTSPPLDVAGHGRALLALLDTAGIGRAVFVGTSLGSQVVAQLAADHPDRVLGLVLVSPTFDPAEPSLRRQLLRLGADVAAEWPSVWFEHLRDFVLAGPSRVMATVRRGWEHRIDEVLPSVRVPAVVVRGSRDPLVSRSWARKAASILPNGRALEVRGGPRLLGHGSPAALASIIEEHVAAVAAVARPRADGTLPIHLVTAAHRRRPEARPRKARAGPPRA